MAPKSPARPTGTAAPRSSSPPRRTCRSHGRWESPPTTPSIALIDRLPREHRQPSLLFSVARWLGAPAGRVAASSGSSSSRSGRGSRRLRASAARRPTRSAGARRCSPRSIASPGRSRCSRWAPRPDCASASTPTPTASTTGRSIGDGPPLLECRTSGGRTCADRPARHRLAAGHRSRAAVDRSRLARRRGGRSPGSRPSSRPTAPSASPGSAPRAPPSRPTRPRSWPATRSRRCPRVAATAPSGADARDRRARNPRLPAARRPCGGR